MAGRIRNSPGDIILVVRDASDPGAAAAALQSAAADIANLDAGVEHATVVAPAQGGAVTSMPWSNDGLERAVSLRLYPPPPMRWREFATIPDQWLAEAADWVNRAAEDDTVHARVVATEFPLQPEHTEAFLRQARNARSSSVELVSGELGERIRMAGGYFFSFEPNVSLSGGGPAASDDERVEVFEALVAVARRLAPSLGYAMISFDDRFSVGSRPTYELWKLGGEPPELIENLCDEYVFDAFPYQILSPGHIQQLGGVPAGGRELGGGRVEFAIGDPRQWLLEPRQPMVFGYDPFVGHRRDPEVVEKGRRLLAPCLLRSGDEGRLELLKARRARGDAMAREKAKKANQAPAGATTQEENP